MITERLWIDDSQIEIFSLWLQAKIQMYRAGILYNQQEDFAIESMKHMKLVLGKLNDTGIISDYDFNHYFGVYFSLFIDQLTWGTFS